MKKVSVFFLALLCVLFEIDTFAQELSIEKTYEITGKANRGFLGDVAIDEPGNKVELTYCTKSTDRKAKFETYVFDMQFNFIELKTEELEFEKARTKFRWFTYKGDEYKVEAVSVEANLLGTLVLKRKLITYSWNWFWGGYDKYVKLLEKVKPKNDEGNKYFLHRKAENDVTGEVMVIVGEKQAGKGADPYAIYKNFSALIINKDLDITKTTEFKFDHPQTIVSSFLVSKEDVMEEESEDLSSSDYALMFAPMGGAGFKKVADPDPKNYTFVRFENNANLMQRTAVPTQFAAWAINSIVTIDGMTYIYGPAKPEDDYANTTLVGDLDAMKWKSFQMAKLSTKGVEWVSAPLIDDFEAKVQGGPNQKKVPAYKGKKFRSTGIVVSANDIFIMGQNFQSGKDGVREYTNPIMFQFSSKGDLKAQYGMRREENNQYAKSSPCMQKLILSDDGSAVYWMIGEVKGIREDKELGNSKFKVLLYPNVAKISMNASTIGDFQFFGQEKFFLNNAFPFLPIDQNKSVVFFGESKSGRTLWFGKMPTK
jgi:hypothetical protein